MVLGAGWLHTVPRRRSGRALSTVTDAHPVISDYVKTGPTGYTIDTAPSTGWTPFVGLADYVSSVQHELFFAA